MEIEKKILENNGLGTPLLFPPNLEEAERQLELLDQEVQNVMWGGDDDSKKALVYASRYQFSRMISEYRSKAAETSHQRELIHTILRTEEREKQCIAKTMHDDMGIRISSMKLQLSFLVDKGDLSAADKKILLENIAHLNSLAASLKDITTLLSPPTLKYLGYFGSLEALCVQLSNSRIVVDSTLPKGMRFESEKELHLYGITQELLNNIIKHTQACEIQIKFNYDYPNATLLIQYNADGLTNEAAGELIRTAGGSGLRNIESRAQFIGADVNYARVRAGLSQISVVFESKELLINESARLGGKEEA